MSTLNALLNAIYQPPPIFDNIVEREKRNDW